MSEELILMNKSSEFILEQNIWDINNYYRILLNIKANSQMTLIIFMAQK